MRNDLVQQYKTADDQERRALEKKQLIRLQIVEQIKALNTTVIERVAKGNLPASLFSRVDIDLECKGILINMIKGRLEAEVQPEVNGYSFTVWNRAARNFSITTYTKSRVSNEDLAKSLARVYTNHSGVFIDDEYYSF